jgi:putative ABC transport system permease protein
MLVIVLLGVLGLISLTINKRTKEIGIRKVLGASISNVLLLISRQYIRMILLAFAIAVPLSYYFMVQWLNAFAYQIAISWWMFVFPGVFVFLITLLVAGSQSLKVALTNPTQSLKYE